MKQSLGLLVFLAFVCGSLACCENSWVKLNDGLVCFESRNDKPGVISSVHDGFVGAVKLVYKSGKIRCNVGASHDSYFGCDKVTFLGEYTLSVFVTDSQKKIKFPTSHVTYRAGTQKAFYKTDGGFTSMSPELVLQSSFTDPTYISKGEVLQIWYGEDYVNNKEGDNAGRVCVDVYGYVI